MPGIGGGLKTNPTYPNYPTYPVQQQGQIQNPVIVQGGNNQSGKCKYGNNCRKNMQGKCPLDHSGPNTSNNT